MDESAPSAKHAVILSKGMLPESWQPLEVHHLSHDLRGPLNSILGFSELLLEGIEGPLNETQSEDIVAIYRSAQNLLLLINNLVDISKLEANRLSFDFGPVDLNKVMNNVASFDFGSLKPEQLELVVEDAPTTPLIWGDIDRIEQMILSLIRFAFNIKRRGQIVLSAHKDSEKVIIQVGAAGATIPAAELNNLFELVVKVDPAGRSELGKGGLDLPLARRLAESHKGRAWIESDEATGTALYLELPVLNEANAQD